MKFDLSTLSDINSPQRKLKSVIRELINCCFNGGDRQLIGITRYGAFWTNSQEKHRSFFNKTFLKLAIDYLLDNSYFALGSLCFRQLVGIPMRCDLAPYINIDMTSSNKKNLRKA